MLGISAWKLLRRQDTDFFLPGSGSVLPVPTNPLAQGITITTLREAYVAITSTDSVIVIDTATDQLIAEIPVGLVPIGVDRLEVFGDTGAVEIYKTDESGNPLEGVGITVVSLNPPGIKLTGVTDSYSTSSASGKACCCKCRSRFRRMPPPPFFNRVTAISDEAGDDAEAVVEVNALPGIEVIKSADREVVVEFEEVVYTISVTNTGNVPLTNVFVNDSLIPVSVPPFTLGIGETREITVSITASPPYVQDGRISRKTLTRLRKFVSCRKTVSPENWIVTSITKLGQSNASPAVDPLIRQQDVFARARPRATPAPGTTKAFSGRAARHLQAGCDRKRHGRMPPVGEVVGSDGVIHLYC